MKVVTVPIAEVPAEFIDGALEGWVWGCQCGESWQTQEGAESCHKCRVYLHGTTEVYFIKI